MTTPSRMRQPPGALEAALGDAAAPPGRNGHCKWFDRVDVERTRSVARAVGRSAHGRVHLSGSGSRRSAEMAVTPAFLFDLDGTLVDSVYQHVLAWREALEAAGIELSVWRIHRRIGMSGGLLVNALLRETGDPITAEQVANVQRLHAAAYARQVGQIRPLPGARELLQYLTDRGVPWTIATSGRIESARPALDVLGIHGSVPVVTRDQVEHAKPDPDLFLAAA